MLPALRSAVYPLFLLCGALLICIAAGLHPHLTGGGADELGAIAASEAWKAIHWAFLFGFGLSLTGLAGIIGRCAGTAGEGAARAGIIVLTFAYAGWMVVVTFMVGAGWMLARAHAGGGDAAAQAIFVYDALRPFALAAQRAGGFALGISTYLLGWGVLQARVGARWVGWSGMAGGVVAVALAVLFGEATKADQAAFAPPVLWQLLIAVVLLAERPRAA